MQPQRLTLKGFIYRRTEILAIGRRMACQTRLVRSSIFMFIRNWRCAPDAGFMARQTIFLWAGNWMRYGDGWTTCRFGCCRLSRCRLSRCRLSRCRLSRCRLSRCRLGRCRLGCCRLGRCRLCRCRGRGFISPTGCEQYRCDYQ